MSTDDVHAKLNSIHSQVSVVMGILADLQLQMNDLKAAIDNKPAATQTEEYDSDDSSSAGRVHRGNRTRIHIGRPSLTIDTNVRRIPMRRTNHNIQRAAAQSDPDSDSEYDSA